MKASSARILDVRLCGAPVLVHMMPEDMWLVRPGTSSATPTLTFDVSGHEERAGLGTYQTLALQEKQLLLHLQFALSRFRRNLSNSRTLFVSFNFHSNQSTLVLDAILFTLPATLQ